MHMVFRDHSLSDLIGFVYAGVPAQTAAEDMLRRIRYAAQPVLDSGRDAIVSIVLDGENAWEFYPQSGRELLRRLYDAIAKDPGIEAATISEAIAKQKEFAPLHSLVPGSWINANFNVWIGAPEDNKAWDFLKAARDFYDEASPRADENARKLAYEELLIAEGSDWNWWYGPEHHSANDSDFDELYRNHLSNVYRLLGANPPDYLHHPISAETIGKTRTIPQTAYIFPQVSSPNIGYFDWLGAASFTADRRGSSMHGKKFLLERAYAGINEQDFFIRLDFASELQGGQQIETRIEVQPSSAEKARKTFIAKFHLSRGKVVTAELSRIGGTEGNDSSAKHASEHIESSFEKMLRARVPLSTLGAQLGDTLLLRFTIFSEQLPIDS